MNRRIGAALAVLSTLSAGLTVQQFAFGDDGKADVPEEKLNECMTKLAGKEEELKICLAKPTGGTSSTAPLVPPTNPPPPPKKQDSICEDGKKVKNPSDCCPEGKTAVPSASNFLKIVCVGGNKESLVATPGTPGAKGDKGDPGDPGAPGTPGANGKDGKDAESVRNFRFEVKLGPAVTFSPVGTQIGPELNAKFIFGSERQRFVLNAGVGDAVHNLHTGWLAYFTGAVGVRFCLNGECSVALDGLVGFRQHFHLGGANMIIGNQQFDNDVLAGTVGTAGLDLTFHPGDGMFIFGGGAWGGYGTRLNYFVFDTSGAAHLRSSNGLTAGVNLFVGLTFF